MMENEDLERLERLFFKFGSTESDEDLQTCVSRVLTPLIHKVSSNDERVRSKVLELLAHINKRVRSRSVVQLPVKELLAQFMDSNAASFITNFSMIYIKMGYPRLPQALQCQLVPDLFLALEGKPEPQQDSILLLLLPVLRHIELPHNIDKRREMFALHSKPNLTKLILSFMVDTLLLPYANVFSIAPTDHRPHTAPAGPASSSTSRPTQHAPPGLSHNSVRRIQGQKPPTPEQIENIKLGIVRFLCSDILPATNVAVALLVASSDTRHSVATMADLEIKRLLGIVDWNCAVLISQIYTLYMGSQSKKINTRPDFVRPAAHTRVKLKLLPYLLKSTHACNSLVALHVVFDCLFGVDSNARLRLYGLQFVHHLCIGCTVQRMKSMGPALHEAMMKVIRETENNKLRRLAYVAIGKLSKCHPQYYSKNIALLTQLFDDISKVDAETKLAIQECLNMLVAVYVNMDTAELNLIQSLLLSNIEKNENMVRLMVVHYTNEIFHTTHIPSRYILLLAAGDSKDDIAKEAKLCLRGLRWTVEDQKEKTHINYPPFTDMVNYIIDKSGQRLGMGSVYVTATSSIPFNPITFSEIVLYLRMCLAAQCGLKPGVDSEIDMRSQAGGMSLFIDQLITRDGSNALQGYISLLIELLQFVASPMSLYLLLEIVSVSRNNLSSVLISKLKWIKTLMFTSREETRVLAAELFANVIVSPSTNSETFHSTIQQLNDNLKLQNKPELVHGAALALGFIYKQEILIAQEPNTSECQHEDVSKDSDMFKMTVTNIVELLGSEDEVIRSASLTALSQFAIVTSLPLSDCTTMNNESETTPSKSLPDVIHILGNILTASKVETKVKEKAAVLLGYLPIGDPFFKHTNTVLEKLLESSKLKQFDLQLTVGVALTNAGLGAESTVPRNPWSPNDNRRPHVSRDTHVSCLVTTILDTYLPLDSPSVRLACSLWLVCVLRLCGMDTGLKSKLKPIQLAFMELLNEKDELCQEMASKGLGLVHELSDDDMKEELVYMVMDNLIPGRRMSQNTEEKVLEDQSQTTLLSGSGLAMYRELCCLALDIGRPCLVFKLMQLAHHNALWTSKKGADLGFSQSASIAGADITNDLSRVVPKLYRYQFDPTARVRNAMTSIWSALVTETNKTIDTYLAEICEDLKQNLSSSKWEVRESSCLALADMLKRPSIDTIIDIFPELWINLFRCIDDIKESVRKAAEVGLAAVSKISIKLCTSQHTTAGRRSIELILPVLLENGLTSKVKEVNSISLSTLIEISKTAGGLMKAHIPVFVRALLNSLSDYEPAEMNYISLHIGKNQDSQEKLDNIRISAVKTSQQMSTINTCLVHVDESVMGILVPILLDVIRSSVGVATKAACSHFLNNICLQLPKHYLEPYGAKILKAYLANLSERSAAIRKSYSVTISYVVKVTKLSVVEKLLLRMKDWYFHKDDIWKHTVALVLHAMSINCPDLLKSHGSDVAALVFLAMHQKTAPDQLTSTKVLMEEVWQEITPGLTSGIRLYLKEIIQITKQSLDDQSWIMKAQASLSICTVATRLSVQLPADDLSNLFSHCISGLNSRTYEGKENLLLAVKTICISCRNSLVVNETTGSCPSVTQAIDVLLRESKKDQLKYITVALPSLCTVLDAYQINRFTEVYTIIKQFIQPKISHRDSSDESDDESYNIEHKKEIEIFLDQCYQCLALAWPTDHETQAVYQEDVCTILSQALSRSQRRTQLLILKTMQTIVKKMYIFSSECLSEEDILNISTIASTVLKHTRPCSEKMVQASVQHEALNLIEITLNKLKDVSVNMGDIVPTLTVTCHTLNTLATEGKTEIQDQARGCHDTATELINKWKPPEEEGTENMMENEIVDGES